LSKIGYFRNLEHLNVSCCGLNTIVIDEEAKLFPSLKHLNISGNGIEKLESVEELRKLSNLKSLIILNNPFRKLHKAEDIRQLIIASVRNIESLDHIVITPEERRSSDLDYLKRFAVQWHASQSSDEQKKEFDRKYPVYSVIVKKYGPPDPVGKSTVSRSLKASMITLNVLHNDRHIQKDFVSTMQIKKIKPMIQKLLKLDNQNFSLRHRSHWTPLVDQELDKEQQSLSYYCVENHDGLIVVENK